MPKQYEWQNEEVVDFTDEHRRCRKGTVIYAFYGLSWTGGDGWYHWQQCGCGASAKMKTPTSKPIITKGETK